VNDQKKKMWESAYTVMNHPRMGPYMHGAAMVERTTGVDHVWLVRGPCTQSVVQELQRQLGKAYNFKRLNAGQPAPRQPEPKPRTADRTLAGILLFGLIGFAVCAFGRSK
jgi:hypothetical protein